MKKLILSLVVILMSNGPEVYAGNGDLMVTGNVGIGTTTPGSKLEVLGANNTRIAESVPSGANGRYSDLLFRGTFSNYPSDVYRRNVGLIRSGFSTGTWNTGYLSFGVAGSDCYTDGDTDPCTRMIITNNGNVGIGTSNPAARLHINAASNKRNLYLSSGALVPYSSLSSKWNLPTTDSGNATLSVITNNWDTSNGIGLLVGSNVASPIVWMYDSGGRNAFTVARKSYSGSGENISDIDNYLTPLFQIRESGNVGIGTTSPAYKLDVQGTVASNGQALASDAKFKKNLLPIETPLSKVLKMNGVSYEWKIEEFKDRGFPQGRHYGVIAQETEKVLPEIVTERPDGTKTVAYNEIIPVLLEAIKEQQKMITQLQKTNEQQQKQLDKLHQLLKR